AAGPHAGEGGSRGHRAAGLRRHQDDRGYGPARPADGQPEGGGGRHRQRRAPPPGRDVRPLRLATDHGRHTRHSRTHLQAVETVTDPISRAPGATPARELAKSPLVLWTCIAVMVLLLCGIAYRLYNPSAFPVFWLIDFESFHITGRQFWEGRLIEAYDLHTR